MRCSVCDVELTDGEASRKHPETREYLDTCNKCLQEIFNYDLDDDMSDIKLMSKYIHTDRDIY